ncbi:MAG: hypothetical protein ACXWYP_09865, partial [Pseudonocardia sp.]
MPADQRSAALRNADPRCNVTVLPGDPPRDCQVAFWGGPPGHDGDATGSRGSAAEVELVLPAGQQLRRRRVAARLLPLADALAVLLSAPSRRARSAGVDTAVDAVSDSFAAWSTAAVAGIGLVARGRLRPARAPEGWGAWRVGPL